MNRDADKLYDLFDQKVHYKSQATSEETRQDIDCERVPPLDKMCEW
jgi:hypothetical protein